MHVWKKIDKKYQQIADKLNLSDRIEPTVEGVAESIGLTLPRQSVSRITPTLTNTLICSECAEKYLFHATAKAFHHWG